MRYKTVDTIPNLSENMENILISISKSRSLPASLVQRSRVILLSAKGMKNQDIAGKVGLHYNNVAKWRTRFIKALPALYEVENAQHAAQQAGGPVQLKLEDAIRNILSDAHRAGKKSRFTQEQVSKIINLACTNPIDYGYEVSQWSLPLLKKEIEKQKIVDFISVGAIYNFLKSSGLKTS